MTLPTAKIVTTATVPNGDGAVAVRALTRAELGHPKFMAAAQAIDRGKMTRLREMECRMLAYGLELEHGLDISTEAKLDEALVAIGEWWDVQPAVFIVALVDKIGEISGFKTPGASPHPTHGESPTAGPPPRPQT